MNRANFYTNAGGTKVEIKLSTNNQTGTGTGPTGTGPPDWTGPDRSDIRGAEASHQGSRIKHQGSWTLFWHEWAF